MDRAVEYAYETRTKFPDKRTFLVGEIIHNPHVNQKLAAMGVAFLHRPEGRDGDFDFSAVSADDVGCGAIGRHSFPLPRLAGCSLCGEVLWIFTISSVTSTALSL